MFNDPWEQRDNTSGAFQQNEVDVLGMDNFLEPGMVLKC